MRKDTLRSTRSSSRARTTERGFALAIAIILAVLYFGLIELLMLDASRQLADARRFRARIVALTLAENGAELVAAGITTPKAFFKDEDEDAQGNCRGTMTKGALNETTGETPFLINAEGAATGVAKQKATVSVRGTVKGGTIRIEYTDHSQ
jgi:hypothetical protein